MTKLSSCSKSAQSIKRRGPAHNGEPQTRYSNAVCKRVLCRSVSLMCTSRPVYVRGTSAAENEWRCVRQDTDSRPLTSGSALVPRVSAGPSSWVRMDFFVCRRAELTFWDVHPHRRRSVSHILSVQTQLLSVFHQCSTFPQV